MPFYLLVLVLSIPFWVLGAVTGIQLLPGLPIGALMVLAPAGAALILVTRSGGTRAAVALLKRAVDYARIPSITWVAITFLLMPALMLLAYGALRLAGRPVAAPPVAPLVSLLMLLAYVLAAMSEELGWCGYALDPLQARWGALGAGVILGLAWAAWHFVPLLQAGREPAWIAWWVVFTVALRVVFTWLYNSTGKSVGAVALCHGLENFCSYVFPLTGVTYDPRFTAPIAVGLATIVTLLRRPRASPSSP